MDAATEEIVYDESVRVLDSQDTGLRGRAGTLLAAASLATAFLERRRIVYWAHHGTVDRRIRRRDRLPGGR